MSFVVIIIVAGAAGAWTWRFVDFRDCMEAWTIRLYVGLYAAAVLSVGLGSLSLDLASLAFIVVGAASIVYGISRRRRRSRTVAVSTSVEPLGRMEWICAGVLGLSFLIGLITALAPDTSWDGAVAHLALPGAYTIEGRITFLEGNAYSAYPHLAHSLYAVAFYQGGELAVTLLNWSLSLLSCAAAYCLGRRISGRLAGFIAAALLATAPIFFEQIGTASIDVVFTGFILAALSALFAWRQDHHGAWLVIAAVILGSAWGIRHTAYLISVFLIIGVVLVARSARTRRAVIFTGVVGLAAAPWLLRSALLVGNPVYPLFGAPELADADITAVAAHESVGRITLAGFLMYPWDIVMKPYNFDGWAKSPGPFVLLLGIPGLLVGGSRAWSLGVFAFAGILAFYFFQQFARYLLPFFGALMAVAAIAPERLPPLRKAIFALLTFGFCYGLLLGIAMIHFKIPAALGLEDRGAYLARRVERYPAFQWVNINLRDDLGPGEKVFTLDPRSYYLDVPSYHNYESLRRIRDRSLAEQVAWLHARGIKYVFYPERYLEESPGYRESGYIEHLGRWRANPAHFRRIQTLFTPIPQEDGVERIEIYEVVPPRSTEASPE